MVGIVLLTLGALSALLALTVETCTQGSADSLYGGFVTLFLYLAGGGALIASRPRPEAFLALVVAAAAASMHSVFAVRFAWGFWTNGMSACFAMNGGFTPDDAGEWMDGGEPLLTALWLTVSIVFWVSVAVALRRSIKSDWAA